MARLIIESPDGRGREYKIVGAVVIGRLKTNPVPIDDGKASREHAAVRVSGADHVLTDLESRNGTYHNGEIIRGPIRLKNGDRIAIGSTEFRFVEDPEDQARRAELAAKASGPAPLLVQAPVPKAEPPRPPAPPPSPRPEAYSALARAKGQSGLEKALSFAIHALLFVLSTFVSYKVAGLLIRSLMK